MAAARSSRPAVPRGVRVCPPDISLQGNTGPSRSLAESEHFTRGLRLLSQADFKRVFEKACRAGNRYLTLLARPNGLGHPRLGMAISRKHVRRAVARNRIKRQVRESFRLHQQVIGDLDVIFLARPDITELDTRRLRQYVDKYWRDLAKRCKSS